MQIDARALVGDLDVSSRIDFCDARISVCPATQDACCFRLLHLEIANA